jgi:two-component system OmpR family response regulator
MRILLIEDEADLARPLKKALEKQGYAVDWFDDGEKGYRNAKINEYDCCLLDLNLPSMDGVEIAKKLREEGSDMPIIMLTARSQMYDKLEGFHVGTDDYITKPFHLPEVFARIKAVIKRSSENKDQKLMLKEYEVMVERNMLKSETEEITLSNKEMGILEYLLRNSGRVVSAEEILEHVWDREVDMFSDTVKTHMKTLRKKMDPEKTIIKTIKGKGYVVD